ncbi:VWA domain-containing protein [Streptomyces sp. NPDC058291]|uniref:VWA domain-containing protein n=1 Tax=Streptomyces sp. NPDC058291 TaxID=3346427 RepID=UPI0036EDD836
MLFTSVDDVCARPAESGYGVALGEFAQRHGAAAGPRTTVFVLGDARTDMGDTNLSAVREIAERARRLHWSNPEPEPRSRWGTGDSAAPEYAELVAMHECRNARRLGALIGVCSPSEPPRALRALPGSRSPGVLPALSL